MTTERLREPELNRVKTVQKVSDQSEQHQSTTIAPDSDLVDRVTCRDGDNSCANAHASTLNRATSLKLSRAGNSLLQLQRQYGNHYVERVLTLARKTSGEGETDAGAWSNVESAIDKKRGGGNQLDSGVQRQMEGALGADFSGVRVHVDTQSDDLNRSLSARAFTTGQDIFFSKDAYQPGSSTGRELIAHELTHVVQQDGNKVRRAMTVSQPGDPHEVEAEETARAVMHSETSGGSKEEDEEKKEVSASAPGAQRQPEGPSKDEDEEKKKHAATMRADRSLRAGLIKKQ
jgi:hypothetical protein